MTKTWGVFSRVRVGRRWRKQQAYYLVPTEPGEPGRLVPVPSKNRRRREAGWKS